MAGIILRLRCLWRVLRLDTEGLPEAEESLIEMQAFYQSRRDYMPAPYKPPVVRKTVRLNPPQEREPFYIVPEDYYG